MTEFYLKQFIIVCSIVVTLILVLVTKVLLLDTQQVTSTSRSTTTTTTSDHPVTQQDEIQSFQSQLLLQLFPQEQQQEHEQSYDTNNKHRQLNLHTTAIDTVTISSSFDDEKQIVHLKTIGTNYHHQNDNDDDIVNDQQYLQPPKQSTNNTTPIPATLIDSNHTYRPTGSSTSSVYSSTSTSSTILAIIPIYPKIRCPSFVYERITCQSTILIENITINISSIIPILLVSSTKEITTGNNTSSSTDNNETSTTILQSQLCNQLHRYYRNNTVAKNNFIRVPVCIQTTFGILSHGGILVQYTTFINNNDNSNYISILNDLNDNNRNNEIKVDTNDNNSTSTGSTSNTTSTTLNSLQQYGRIVPLKRLVFLSYYNIAINDTTNTIYEQYRDNNYGNMIWRYGASILINPLSTEIISTSTSTSNRIDNNTIDAILIPTANLLHISKQPLYKEHIEQMTQYVTTNNVSTAIIGIGIQVEFDTIFTEDTISTLLSTTNITLPYDYQTNFLYEVSQHQLSSSSIDVNNNKNGNIGVRGIMTQRICTNSNITSCVVLGCPSLTISRNTNLGVTLQSNWNQLIQFLKNINTTTTMNRISIALTSPAGSGVNVDISYAVMAYIIEQQLLLNNHNVTVTIIEQSKSDVPRFKDFITKQWHKQKYYSKSINITQLLNNINSTEFVNTESWLHSAYNDYTICISFRLHGSMPFTSMGIPTIVIPTDFRVMELILSMKLPHLLVDTVHTILVDQQKRQQTEEQKQEPEEKLINNTIVEKNGNNNNSSSTTTTTTSTTSTTTATKSPKLVSFLLLLLTNAYNTNFTVFEINRRQIIHGWKTMLENTGTGTSTTGSTSGDKISDGGIQIDPSLLQILMTPM